MYQATSPNRKVDPLLDAFGYGRFDGVNQSFLKTSRDTKPAK